uniref:GDP-fucose protein O-fucosyltransferase 2 n=1 Tax=Aplanochytrium stocchinoi TaxID=215587 RepID=A0A7S3PNK2_9STRA
MRLRMLYLACFAIFLCLNIAWKQYAVLRYKYRLSAESGLTYSVPNENSFVEIAFGANSGESKKEFFESGKWKTPGEKFVFYQPSGGVSNQRILLEHAMFVAYKLNRTLILPPIGPHTAQWFKYNKEDIQDVVSMLRIFDKVFMERIIKVIQLEDITVTEFCTANLDTAESDWDVFLPVPGKKYPYTLKRLMSRFEGTSNDVIFFSKGSLWKLFKIPSYEASLVRYHVRLRPEFRHIARKAAYETLGHVYNALHIRFPDSDGTNKRLGWLSPNEEFVRRMVEDGFFTKTNLVYVATKSIARKHVFFDIFPRKGFDLVFSDRLLESVELRNFIATFPLRMSETILGLVEQLVCSRSQLFLGTGYSTFSMYIRYHREQRIQMVDTTLVTEPLTHEHVEANTDIDAVIKVLKKIGQEYGSKDVLDEVEILNVSTPCDRPMQVC